MCLKSEEVHYSFRYSSLCFQRASKGHKLRIHRLNRRRRVSKQAKEEVEMEINNLKLYIENKSIIEENERLRKKANMLRQENQALLSQLQKKFSQSQNNLAHRT